MLSPGRTMSKNFILNGINSMIISKLPLRILREYFIVTLACEAEKQFEAHEIVIASSNPLFQTTSSPTHLHEGCQCQSNTFIWELSLWPHAMCMIIGFIDISVLSCRFDSRLKFRGLKEMEHKNWVTKDENIWKPQIR